MDPEWHPPQPYCAVVNQQSYIIIVVCEGDIEPEICSTPPVNQKLPSWTAPPPEYQTNQTAYPGVNYHQVI